MIKIKSDTQQNNKLFLKKDTDIDSFQAANLNNTQCNTCKTSAIPADVWLQLQNGATQLSNYGNYFDNHIS